MDYLVIEGYKTAAEEFSKEANLPPPVDLETIESRMNIRDAVQRGEVEDAIAQVNDLNPDVSVLISLVLVVSRHRYDYTVSCTTLRPLGSVMRLVNQNFSLQYDLSFSFSALFWLLQIGLMLTYYLDRLDIDSRHQP